MPRFCISDALLIHVLIFLPYANSSFEVFMLKHILSGSQHVRSDMLIVVIRGEQQFGLTCEPEKIDPQVQVELGSNLWNRNSKGQVACWRFKESTQEQPTHI